MNEQEQLRILKNYTLHDILTQLQQKLLGNSDFSNREAEILETYSQKSTPDDGKFIEVPVQQTDFSPLERQANFQLTNGSEESAQNTTKCQGKTNGKDLEKIVIEQKQINLQMQQKFDKQTMVMEAQHKFIQSLQKQQAHLKYRIQQFEQSSVPQKQLKGECLTELAHGAPIESFKNNSSQKSQKYGKQQLNTHNKENHLNQQALRSHIDGRDEIQIDRDQNFKHHQLNERDQSYFKQNHHDGSQVVKNLETMFQHDCQVSKNLQQNFGDDDTIGGAFDGMPGIRTRNQQATARQGQGRGQRRKPQTSNISELRKFQQGHDQRQQQQQKQSDNLDQPWQTSHDYELSCVIEDRVKCSPTDKWQHDQFDLLNFQLSNSHQETHQESKANFSQIKRNKVSMRGGRAGRGNRGGISSQDSNFQLFYGSDDKIGANQQDKLEFKQYDESEFIITQNEPYASRQFIVGDEEHYLKGKGEQILEIPEKSNNCEENFEEPNVFSNKYEFKSEVVYDLIADRPEQKQMIETAVRAYDEVILSEQVKSALVQKCSYPRQQELNEAQKFYYEISRSEHVYDQREEFKE